MPVFPALLAYYHFLQDIDGVDDATNFTEVLKAARFDTTCIFS
jgi:hypothetical protein